MRVDLASFVGSVALANPVIEWSSKDEEIDEEGCLSLPLVHIEVERPVHVRVRAQDEYGEPITIEARSSIVATPELRRIRPTSCRLARCSDRSSPLPRPPR